MKSIRERYSSLPRATKWAIWGAVVIGLYFGFVEPAVENMNRTNIRADKQAKELSDFAREREARRSADAATTEGIARYGQVEPPGPPGARSEIFNKRIADVLKAADVKQPSIQTREVELAKGPLSAKLAADERVERLINQITFEADPEKVSSVIAELEKIPEVAAVSRVEIKTAAPNDKTTRLLKATVVAEAWQIKKKERAR